MARALHRVRVMRRTFREITTFSASVAAVWFCLGTGVLHADDAHVAQTSQGDAPTASTRADTRRWQLPDWERPPTLPGATRPKPDYTGWLTVSYVSFPVLFIGVPLLLADVSNDGELVAISWISATVIALSLPALVHAFNGDGSRARRALGFYVLGAVLGIIPGLLLGGHLTTNEDNANSDGGATLRNAIIGGLVGAHVGAAIWAVYDVLETARSVGEREPVAERNRTRFDLLPHPSGILANVSGRF